jgi:biotin transport system substrate-specific component
MNYSSSAASQSISFGQSAALRKLSAVVLGSVFVALCAHVAVPLYFTPVPLTLQTFAVLLIGLAFGPAAGLTTLALYLFEGLAGLPVFSPHGPGGILQIMGPTGGYLLSYPLAAALAGWLFRRPGRNGFVTAVIAAAAGNVLILAAGATWLGALTHLTARTTFSLAVLPFLPGDLLKTLAAAGAGAGIWRWRQLKYRAL